MITLNNISMKYKGSNQYVLKNINLSLPDNGLIFIVGSSGSGKSTLLNLIAGFIKPTKGDIYVNNKNITKFKKNELNNYIKREISIIHQHYDLIKYITVADNIKLRNRSYNENILKKLKISELKNKKVSELSGGEMQRCAIARALSCSSSILLADEPTGALDSKNSIKIIKILKKLAKDRLVIVVTHNNELTKYGNRIITIKDGMIKKDVNKSTVINKRIYNNQSVIKKNIISLVLKNILNKYKRNILIILAFSIGLITLLLVLSIRDGFNNAMINSEMTSLASYPITISEDSYNIDDELSDIFKKEDVIDDKIIIKDAKHKNIIDNRFMKYINTLDKYAKGIDYLYIIDDIIINRVNIDNLYNEAELIYGNYITNNNEILLLINKYNMIDSNIANILNLDKDILDYYDIVGKKIIIDNEEFNIVGIIKGKEESYYSDSNGLFTNYAFNGIPYSISIIPKDYISKNNIIKSIRDYGDIEFTDYASSIKKISTNIVDGISIVLIIFSLISLIVSAFMIGIITYISVIERVREIGILKSIGYSNSDVKRIFYLENLILTIIAILLSIIMIILISIPLNNILFNLIGFDNIILINNNNLLYTIIIGIVISLIGSLLPIRKVSKLDVLSALNYED